MNKFTFFWKSKSPFSQWYGDWMGKQYNGSFILDEIKYPTAEHYMISEKARLFDDMQTFDLIMRADHPKKAKDLGRKVKNFDKKIWEEKCQQIVFDANYAKFTQNENLKNILLETGDTLLVEASPFDAIWGIGLEENEAKEIDHEMWPGKNLLGIILTNVREKIKQDF